MLPLLSRFFPGHENFSSEISRLFQEYKTRYEPRKKNKTLSRRVTTKIILKEVKYDLLRLCSGYDGLHCSSDYCLTTVFTQHTCTKSWDGSLERTPHSNVTIREIFNQ